ncbi:MAG TPA: hypothetical protein P5049_05980 [Methanothrix sp.]|nr:hypothetical protein [Methanothrix sp.]
MTFHLNNCQDVVPVLIDTCINLIEGKSKLHDLVGDYNRDKDIPDGWMKIHLAHQKGGKKSASACHHQGRAKPEKRG